MIGLARTEVNLVAADPQPQPESQDILLARLAALTEADAPPDEQDYASRPRPRR